MIVLDSVFKFLDDLVTPVTTMVDNLNTSDEERLKIKKAMFELEMQTQQKLMELQLESQKLQLELMKNENQYGNWLQKSWRPISMLTMLVLLILSSFQLVVLPDWVGTLFQISFGGYIVGRSGEKIVPNIFKLKAK